jgi:hypothetical protein
VELPNTIYIGVGAVLGALLSIFGVWLSNRSSVELLLIQHNNEKSIRANELKREKLEELYVLVDKWLNGMTGQYLMLALVMEEKIDYNQYLDQVIENGEKESLDFSRFQMIVDMYCHEIESGYQKLMTARDDINTITSAHKRAYKVGDINGEKYLAPYTLAMKNLEQLGSLFKKEIAGLAKQT